MPEFSTFLASRSIGRGQRRRMTRESVVMQTPAWTLVVIGLVIAESASRGCCCQSVPWLGRLPGDIAIEREDLSESEDLNCDLFDFAMRTLLVEELLQLLGGNQPVLVHVGFAKRRNGLPDVGAGRNHPVAVTPSRSEVVAGEQAVETSPDFFSDKALLNMGLRWFGLHGVIL